LPLSHGPNTAMPPSIGVFSVFNFSSTASQHLKPRACAPSASHLTLRSMRTLCSLAAAAQLSGPASSRNGGCSRAHVAFTHAFAFPSFGTFFFCRGCQGLAPSHHGATTSAAAPDTGAGVCVSVCSMPISKFSKFGFRSITHCLAPRACDRVAARSVAKTQLHAHAQADVSPMHHAPPDAAAAMRVLPASVVNAFSATENA
jgi:hypothetical protein